MSWGWRSVTLKILVRSFVKMNETLDGYPSSSALRASASMFEDFRRLIGLEQMS